MGSETKILIVDDDETLRESLREQFSLHEEFRVSDAATATQGIKALKSEHADIVLLDVNLPDLDGPDFYHEKVDKVTGVFKTKLTVKHGRFFTYSKTNSKFDRVNVDDLLDTPLHLNQVAAWIRRKNRLTTFSNTTSVWLDQAMNSS